SLPESWQPRGARAPSGLPSALAFGPRREPALPSWPGGDPSCCPPWEPACRPCPSTARRGPVRGVVFVFSRRGTVGPAWLGATRSDGAKPLQISGLVVEPDRQVGARRHASCTLSPTSRPKKRWGCPHLRGRGHCPGRNSQRLSDFVCGLSHERTK